MIIKVPKISDKLKDNRKLQMKGMLSKPGDIQEAYRDLCSEYGLSLGKMYSFTKSNTKLDIKGLLMLCKRLDCIFVMDNHLDYFFIKYAPKGVSTVDVTEFITKHEEKAVEKEEAKEKTKPEPKEERFEKIEEPESEEILPPGEEDEEELF